jgi:hypothetical protein
MTNQYGEILPFWFFFNEIHGNGYFGLCIKKMNMSRNLPNWLCIGMQYIFSLFLFVSICSHCSFFPSFCSCGSHCYVGLVPHLFTAIMLTVRGVECAFSLPLDQDRVPIILKIIEIERVTSDCWLSPVWVQVTLSDAIHCSPMILAR